MRQIFAMLSKKKVIFVINMQNYYFQHQAYTDKKIITLVHMSSVRDKNLPNILLVIVRPAQAKKK